MGVNDLQKFLESRGLEGGAVSVDLLKIARNVTQRQQPHNANRKIRPIGNKLKLIIDAENCLDRLYGGFFSDWACGGQWNRMIQFLSLLTRAIERGNIELAVVFNGTIESCRLNEWVADQANVRQKVGLVLKHVHSKATPPPKIWWMPPTCLRSALRMALRHLGIPLMCTMDDHHQEVIAYCREYGFHGLLADDAEYAAFDPPRYFSSEHLKLTYKGSIETKEFMISEMTKTLQVTQEQICIMAALLGNFLLPENELQDVYKKLNMKPASVDNSIDLNVRILAEFVRTLPAPSNLDDLVVAVFGRLDDERASPFKQSVQYYLNGTASGFLKYCAPAVNPKGKKINNNATTSSDNSNRNLKADEQNLDISGFASETTEQEQESLQIYRLATANSMLNDYEALDGCSLNESAPDTSTFNGVSNGSLSTNSSSTKITVLSSNNSSNSNSNPPSPKHASKSPSGVNLIAPTVSADVLRTASLRHQKGLMAPNILHVLGAQEIRLPCLMEDENNREFPPIHEIYLSLRQHVYAVLFNLHHLRYVHTKKKESGDIADNAPQPEMIVREWVYSRANPYQLAVEVKAEPLPWAVPTLQRLWFGPSVDDKRRRMRALLSCMHSDTPLILNTAYVPQHMLLMACVLRYIMSQDKPILRRHELDAFLCHAFNPNLMNSQYLQELTLVVVTSRGAQLAALFMEGVDMALLANDACGAPLPWLMCCPWLFFDGKLFHHTLTRSAVCKNILELCENYIERVVKVERIRKAILEGIEVNFAKVPLQQFPMQLAARNVAAGPQGMRPQHRPLAARGGQLQVAGVVVGSWGPNYCYNQNVRPQHHHAPIVPAGSGCIGGRARSGYNIGLGGGFNQPHQTQYFNGRGRGQLQQRKPGQPSFPTNTRRTQANKKRTNKSNKNQNSRGPALTIKTEDGDVSINDIVIHDDGTTTLKVGGKEDCHKQSTENHCGQGDAPTAEVEAATTTPIATTTTTD